MQVKGAEAIEARRQALDFYLKGLMESDLILSYEVRMPSPVSIVFSLTPTHAQLQNELRQFCATDGEAWQKDGIDTLRA
jgi:hypothetical protein